MSGLSRTPGKRVWANPHRGFESRPLRQGYKKYGPSGPFFLPTHISTHKVECAMAELVTDCPRCNVQKTTFDFRAQVQVDVNYGWQTIHEAFCVCRACLKSTIFILELENSHFSGKLDELNVWGKSFSLNHVFRVAGFISLKDRLANPPPDDLPDHVRGSFEEAAKCVATGCNNAAAAMFRLALDLATAPLLPAVESPDSPTPRVRRDLGLRLGWMFDGGHLPRDLRELSECVREDGNDGAHRGNVTKQDAEDLQDFCFELLDRLYSEPARLAAAKQRREERRGGAPKP